MQRVFRVLILAAMMLAAAPLHAEDPVNTSNITLRDQRGEPFALSSLAGKVVLVNFWATWCPPCKLEMPGFAKLRNELAGQGFEVVGAVYMDNPEPEDLDRLLLQLHVDYPIVQGAPEEMIAFAEAFGVVRGLPTSFLLDREGKVVKRVMGTLNETTLREYLKPYFDLPAQ